MVYWENKQTNTKRPLIESKNVRKNEKLKIEMIEQKSNANISLSLFEFVSHILQILLSLCN